MFIENIIKSLADQKSTYSFLALATSLWCFQQQISINQQYIKSSGIDHIAVVRAKKLLVQICSVVSLAQRAEALRLFPCDQAK